ncbi:tryptophan synthase alpha chain [Virgibacillus pantothenticus]|uniref:tryptophan synthase subunit alpha n=1 Tax=Virgibacillus pantothenticus TaxID=1473 RepID=UPI001B0F074D|nr:tryptophan synthase subunit alpha [Virgibacillus pantothenticus]MBU8565185.1 tryptophan synthase subunit alpha [Virgibacillus pantothenticus]MBU8601469.1 tryptophan synthase subunit alpha [Virgibacillus pantothenticus]MBU8633504.1 tryptophan synthase subunit alpha [Virgibacillus pantothenticus]MBU8643402.1 tryptophan synthase subunit alpha [Virgibacillus pantothenticus]MBU8647543.1 tryptophan synthase subunit alpha [Virgibacillus pantothenticus]
MGKTKLDNYLSAIQANHKKIFVPYIMAGDGGLEKLKEQILFLEACGAAAIEVGIPFSDPVADGPTIQNAAKRALEQQTTLQAVLAALATFKSQRTIPIIIMTYMNPVFVYGVEHFANACAEADVDGVIIPDVPLEEDDLVTGVLKKNDIALIRLVSLTSTKERIQTITQRAEGFLYAVTVKGTTGARSSFDQAVKEYLQQLKQQSNIPVLAGFGVSTSEQAKELASYCDGVIVGSKIVEWLHEEKREAIQLLISSV